MSKGFVNKFKNWIAGDPFEEDVYTAEDEFDAEPRLYQHDRPVAEPAAPAVKHNSHSNHSNRRSSLKVVEHPGNVTSQVVVIEPKSFEEVLEIIEHLRMRKTVVLNLHLLDTNQSQRIVDFLSGATHAVDGHQQRIGDGVFMFTPNNVMITTDSEKDASMLGGSGSSSSSDAYWRSSQTLVGAMR